MDYKLLVNLVSESKLGKAKIATLAGVSRTTLDNAIAGADIKVSTIESVARVLGVDVAAFFGARPAAVSSTATGGSISTMGDNSGSVINSPPEIYERLLREKEDANATLRRIAKEQLDSSQEQLAKAQEQIDKLLVIIERLTKYDFGKDENKNP